MSYMYERSPRRHGRPREPSPWSDEERPPYRSRSPSLRRGRDYDSKPRSPPPLQSYRSPSPLDRYLHSRSNRSNQPRGAHMDRVQLPERRRSPYRPPRSPEPLIPGLGDIPRSRSPRRRSRSPRRRSPTTSNRSRSSDRHSTVRSRKGSPSPDPTLRRSCTIREYIDEECGIVEVKVKAGYPACFFHMSCVWIENPDGNPYGPPVKYTANSKGKSLRELFPIGTQLFVYCEKLNRTDSYFDFLVTAMWPQKCEEPLYTKDFGEQKMFLKQFVDNVKRERDSLVPVALNGLHKPAIPDWEAKVWEIKDDDYGVIDIKGKNVRLNALFHRDSIWLKDGVRAIEHEFFRDKPLREIVSEGQLVNLTARSILLSKGQQVRQSVIELQAIVVSLNEKVIPFTSPRATRLEGGAGAFGTSSNYTPYFFNTSLLMTLNRQLVNFLRISGKHIPDLDPKCIMVPNENGVLAVFQEPATPTDDDEETQMDSTSLFPVLHNSNAVVKELLSDNTGIIENLGKNWLCYFTAGECLLPSNKRVKDCFEPGTKVQIHANLIDQRKPIQYLASLVWNKQDFPNEPPGKPKSLKEMNSSLIQKYFDVNEIFSIENEFENGAEEEEATQAADVEYFESNEGRVVMILDDNYGLIRCQRKLILFDTCDFWMDDHNTAAKMEKKLKDILKISDGVIFHGIKVDNDSKIQYLASAVWASENTAFRGNLRPKPIKRENIHDDKINIYRAVVNAVSPNLPDFSGDDDSSGDKTGLTKIKERKRPKFSVDIELEVGEIKVLFQEGEESGRNQSPFIGGILEFKDGKLCFFMARHCNTIMGLRVGLRVMFSARKVTSALWCKVVPFIALSVFEVREDEKTSERAKLAAYEHARTKLGQIVKMKGPSPEQFLKCIQESRSGIIDIKEAIELVIDDVSSGIVKYMFDEKSGVLSNSFNRENLCYFELADTNLEEPYDLRDALELLGDSHPGIKVRYQARRINKNASIQFVAHAKGVQIIGDLPPNLQHVKFSTAAKSIQFVDLNDEKIKRYEAAEAAFKRRKYHMIRDMMKSLPKKAVGPVGDYVRARGKVKSILNENFGLIEGPKSEDEQFYCLFDTFDLYTSPESTAAESERKVGDVLSTGDDVYYNACLIDPKSSVPYLATGVWKVDNEIRAVDPVSKSAIQADKLSVYKQVAATCASIVDQIRKSDEVAKASEIETDREVIKLRKEDIANLIETHEYRTYTRDVPRRDRKDRDPMTPDPYKVMSSSDWNDKMEIWKGGLRVWFKFNRKSAHVPPRQATPSGSGLIEMALSDLNTKGFMESEDGEFGIVRLENDERALVHKNRVWIHSKPMFTRNFSILFTDQYKKLQVATRKVSDPNGEFTHQVLYCHAAMNYTDRNTGKMRHPIHMKEWIKKKMVESDLDYELDVYFNQRGTKSSSRR